MTDATIWRPGSSPSRSLLSSVTANGAHDNDIDQYHLTDYTDAGAVVLLFYAFDFSPVCPDELCEFRDAEFLTLTQDVDVFGVSTDSAYAHRKTIDTYTLPFPLVSDHDGSISAAYDVLLKELVGHPQVSKRSAFVIDTTDTIQYAWTTDDYVETPAVSEIHEAVKRLDSVSIG